MRARQTAPAIIVARHASVHAESAHLVVDLRRKKMVHLRDEKQDHETNAAKAHCDL